MKKITRVKKPKKSDELYMAQKQLDLTVQAINNRATTLHLELRADIKAMDTRISQMLVLIEEQNNRNRFVLMAIPKFITN